MKYVVICIITIASLFAVHNVQAATITVNTAALSNGGDGFCSLAEAVSNANANSDTSMGDCVVGEVLPTVDIIEFVIPGPGPHTITAASPFYLSEAVTIDGTTQSGTVCTLAGGARQLQVNIDGSSLLLGSGSIFSIGASNITIKGLAIYGNGYGSGIVLSSGNNLTVQCANIGTDANGLAAFPNADDGISIYTNTTSGHIFGGPNPGDGNLVSGNGISSQFTGIGLSCGANNILIQGNWIGVDKTGQAVLKNKNAGIYCGNGGDINNPLTNIQILDNVISGNGTPDDGSYSPGLNIGGAEEAGFNGVVSNVVFRGNIVGLSADGTLDLGNSEGGIYFGATTTNILVENNTISGNGGPAIVVGYDSTDVTIKGNILGLATDGLTRIANTDGPTISIGGPMPGGGGVVSGITIGGILPGERNIISGGYNDGINIGGDVSDVTIIGNIIGPNSTGNTCVENSFSSSIGIAAGASQITIGGSTPAHRNVLGCATFTSITTEGTDVTIEGNYIGVGADGTTSLTTQNTDEQETGMQLNKAATVIGNTIKFNTSEGLKIAAPTGVSLIQNNIIEENANAGIVIFGNPTTPDPVVNILQNRITNNGQTGIKLGTDLDNDYYPDDILEHTTNDIHDTDTGPNGLLNHPVILMTMQDGADTRVLYGLDVPIGTYRIEFFTNPTNGVSSSGFGEGEVYKDYEIISKTSLGFETFTKVLTNTNLDDDITTTTTACSDALCTNYLGTSEFSNTAPPGVDYDATDYTASHVLNTIYLGACVNGDNGDSSNTDSMGPNQIGAYLGTGPCTDDRDGVEFVEDQMVESGPTLQVQYTEIADTPSIDDATFTGTYDGTENNTFSLAFVSAAPGNGDDADYFIWVDTNDNIISAPIKVTPGIPQLLDHGVYVTFASGTGHTPFDMDNFAFGQVWQIEARISGLIPSTDIYTGSYTPGQNIALAITASDIGYVHAWVDVNNDGDFGDIDEWFIVNEEVLAGRNGFVITAPMVVGTYKLRVRYVATSTPNLLPTGVASSGEVEDYTFTVVPTPVVASGGTIVHFGKVCNDPKALNYTTSAGYGDLSVCTYPSGIFATTTKLEQPNTLNTSTPQSPSATRYIFKRTLKLGMKGEDVKKLQEYLNAQGFKISTTGAGSPGKETTYFGLATKNALIKFQEANANLILKPAGLTKGTGFFGVKTMEVVNK